MVMSITSYSRSGLQDWFIQRVTAVIIGVWFFALLFFWLTHPQPIFPEWHHFFSHTAIKILTLFAMLSVILHAWIGMWVVLTDYINLAYLRLFLQVLIIGLLLGYGGWIVKILWGI
jgi:succinate dehydrogenase / fumarate reductase membrane anchor subunit